MLNRVVPPLERLKDKADFEAALARDSGVVLAKSPHFVVHYCPASASLQRQLSTGTIPREVLPVDDSASEGLAPSVEVVKVGAVLPKRLARRAVTRNLLKRQIHAAAARALPQMGAGVWVLRLRSPIDRGAFPSAASDALRCAMREELDALLAQAARRLTARSASPRARERADEALSSAPAAPAGG